MKILPLVIGASIFACATNTHAESPSIMNKNSIGAPNFVTGELGEVSKNTAVQALKKFLASQPSYGMTGQEDFTIKRQWVDSLGKSHTHFDQTINGLKVYGTSMILHANTSSSASFSGNSLDSNSASNEIIYAVTGDLAVESSSLNSLAIISNNDNGTQTLSSALEIGEMEGKPELAYVYLPSEGKTALAWKVDVKYQSTEGFEHDIVFFDADTNEELTRHPLVHRAKVHNTYTLNNQTEESRSVPGQLLCSTGQRCSDDAAQRAHDGTSIMYDYYNEKFQRDSINNRGMNMVSSVHTRTNWNNAVWYKNQMFYGDGDGRTFGDLTKDFDIIGHELTHGVTQFTANLIYRNESGALNEAMSDIFGISAEAWKNNTTSPNWKLGGDAYTPGTAGDALRYMNNPTLDRSSKDYYPERYVGSQDQGGVHWNSGIANLAYVLLVDGGKHPRNKTDIDVPALGLAQSEQIFYRALTTYFNQSTNFAAARVGTAQAAQDLYGASAKKSVETAWCAVGVGSCPGSEPAPGDNVLENGVAKSDLSASRNNSLNFTFEVPAGATNVRVAMSGGSGDADLYVRFAAAPTDSSYDCRPYRNGNTESCTGNESGGTYHVRLKAYQTFSGVSVTASYSN